MFGSEFLLRNTAVPAAMTSFPNLKKDENHKIDNVMECYDQVPKDLVEKHYNEFASKEEMEHYVHELAIVNHEIKPWE